MRLMRITRAAALILALLMTAISFAACGGSKEIKGLDAEFTANFKIEQLGDGIKRVIDGEGRELILVPKANGEVPAEYSDKIVIRTPVERAVMLSTTQVCCLRAAGDETIWDSLAAVSADAYSFSNIPEVVSRMESGKINIVSGDMGDPDYEQLTALNPDLVFVYTGPYPQTGVIEKLTELGISYAVDNEYIETTALARMEWLKFVLTFFEKDQAAADYVDRVKKSFAETEKIIAEAEAPSIAMGYIWDGTVIATDGAGWLAGLVERAKGSYLQKDLSSDALYISVEDFLVSASQADIILYTSTPSFMPGKASLYEMAPLMADTPAAQNNKLYEYTDAFWMSVDQPDVLFADIAQLLHPELFEGRTMTYFTLMAD
ncbi:MAG: ABC transporter substrate-binding protein [Clostridia bacterium]|nr:ABC transporter substrate-binding protein [Clostridia bacterium]